MTKTSNRIAKKASPSSRNGKPSSGRRTKSKGGGVEDQIRLKEREIQLKILETSLSFFSGDPQGIWADKLQSEVGWTTVGMETAKGRRSSQLYSSQEGLEQIILRSRHQAAVNPFARNLYENRINYIIGLGLECKVKSKNKSGRSRLSASAQKFVDELYLENNLDEMLEDITRRTDRDGECFVRRFRESDGMTRFRVIEPFQIRTPKNEADNPNVQYGIRFDDKDEVTPLEYFIHYSQTEVVPVPAEDIIHFKGNVDKNEVRGLPLAYSAYDDLEYASRLRRNMAVVTTVQASIAMIRKHGSAKPESVKNFRDGRDSTTPAMAGLGKEFNPFELLEKAGLPRIWDATQGYDYEFPAVMIDVTKMVDALQAVLRAAAASVQMPEFMLTANAANANYSSSMVSEGPAVRSFGRAQHFFGDRFRNMIAGAIAWAVRSGRIPGVSEVAGTTEGVLSLLDIKLKYPELKTKKSKEETDKRKVLKDEGIMSPQTWAREEDLDYEEQQDEIEQHLKRIQALVDKAEITIDPSTGKLKVGLPIEETVPPSGGNSQRVGGGPSGRRRSPKPRPSRDV